VGLSTDFLIEHKLGTKLSTVKYLQFYLLNDILYSRLFESMGDEKSGEPQFGWL